MKNYKLSSQALVMISGSSIGTQPKYFDKGYWYKTNRAGYENIAEYLMSLVLTCSNVEDFVTYEMCTVNDRAGCRSRSFLGDDESFISFQRLYDIYEGGNLSERIQIIHSVKERIAFVIGFCKEYADVDCTEYLSRILSLDMLSLNTDRHFHNLGIIVNKENGSVRPSPIFDNADALLSNYDRFEAMEPIDALIEKAYAQPFSASHELQADAAGITLRIDYDALYEKLKNEPDSRALQVLNKQLARYRSVLSSK